MLRTRHERLISFAAAQCIVSLLSFERLAMADSSRESVLESRIRSMSLQEALSFARTHHLKISADRARVRAAAQDAEVASAQWLPRIGAMAQLVGSTANNSTTTLLGTSAVDLPRIGATPVSGKTNWQPYPSTAAGIGARQNIYDFGRIAAERAYGDQSLVVQQLHAKADELALDFAVKQSFYAVLAAAAIADASKAALTRAERHRDLAKANVQSGLRPAIELTRAEADVARYEAASMRARAGRRIAQISFAATIGSDDAQIDARADQNAPEPLPGIGRLLTLAGDTPNVAEERARVEAQRNETRKLEAQTRPLLSATASISTRAGGPTPSSGPSPYGDGWIPSIPNYDVGLVFSWPLVEPTWDRRVDVSRAKEAAASFEAELSIRTQRAQIRSAYEEAVVATETLQAAERSAAAAIANWDQAEHRFGVGLGTSTELADAEALRTEAEIQLAIAKFQQWRARAALDHATATARGTAK